MSRDNGGIPWPVWAIVTILTAAIGAYAVLNPKPNSVPTLEPPQSSGQAAPSDSTSRTSRSGAIGACASGVSPSNEFHDAPASNGSWDWNCDGQIEREWGPCENLTRQQCEPNTNATGAPPGFCAQLRAEGGCPPKVGECGKEGYIYPCFYNPADGRCHAGGYELAKVMRCR